MPIVIRRPRHRGRRQQRSDGHCRQGHGQVRSHAQSHVCTAPFRRSAHLARQYNALRADAHDAAASFLLSDLLSDECPRNRRPADSPILDGDDGHSAQKCEHRRRDWLRTLACRNHAGFISRRSIPPVRLVTREWELGLRLGDTPFNGGLASRALSIGLRGKRRNR
jgi:hypothetical protein